MLCASLQDQHKLNSFEYYHVNILKIIRSGSTVLTGRCSRRTVCTTVTSDDDCKYDNF